MTIHDYDRRDRMVALVATVRDRQRQTALRVALAQGAGLQTVHMWVLLTVLRGMRL